MITLLAWHRRKTRIAPLARSGTLATLMFLIVLAPGTDAVRAQAPAPQAPPPSPNPTSNVSDPGTSRATPITSSLTDGDKEKEADRDEAKEDKTAVTEKNAEPRKTDGKDHSSPVGTASTEKGEPKKSDGTGNAHGVDLYLRARCASALCFSAGESEGWLGIEPLVELPVGKSYAIGSGSLINYVNNHTIKIDLAAGLRVWLFRDLVSLSLYLSFPLATSGVRLEGSSFTYPASSLRRPYPGLALGLLYDIIWLGLDHDELRNGDSIDASAYNSDFPANARVSSCTTITIALQFVTASRALFGALLKK